MSAARFDELLRRVALMIRHADAERLAVTIRFLAAGISQQTLAASYKLGTETVCTIIKEVCQALWAGLKDEVKYLQGAQWEAIRGDFWTQWDYPNCIGAIDGKHVHVTAPANSGSSYYNYKGFFCFVFDGCL